MKGGILFVLIIHAITTTACIGFEDWDKEAYFKSLWGIKE